MNTHSWTCIVWSREINVMGLRLDQLCNQCQRRMNGGRHATHNNVFALIHLVGTEKCSDFVTCECVFRHLIRPGFSNAVLSSGLYLVQVSTGYLIPLSVSWLHSVDDRIVNKCVRVGGVRTGKRIRSTRRKLSPQCHFVHHKFHMTWLGIEPRAATIRRVVSL
jgi:hypothetical protein